MNYQCPICGQAHDELPEMAFRWPDQGLAVPESERATRIKGNAETCVVDGKSFFIRGVILLPITGTSGHLGIGAWVSQSPENFQTYLKNFQTRGIGPFFGWLCNSIPFYKSHTWDMKAALHFPGGNRRPVIELASSEHPLYADFSKGITLDKAWSIAHARAPQSA